MGTCISSARKVAVVTVLNILSQAGRYKIPMILVTYHLGTDVFASLSVMTSRLLQINTRQWGPVIIAHRLLCVDSVGRTLWSRLISRLLVLIQSSFFNLKTHHNNHSGNLIAVRDIIIWKIVDKLLGRTGVGPLTFPDSIVYGHRLR